MRKRTTGGLLVLLGGAAALGCTDGGAVNIGDTQTRGAQLSDYAATWDGYVQAYYFLPDQSDRVRVTIAADGHGTLRLGDDALYPPPTDPNVGYPPGIELGASLLGLPMIPVEEFLYPLHAARVEANRLQLGIDPADFWAAWCALQTPVPETPEALSYNCLPNLPFSEMAGACAMMEPDGTSVPVDCGKLALCRMAFECTCTATACAAGTVADGTPPDQYPDELDGALDATGSTLTGTLMLGAGTRLTVILQKQ